MFEGVGPTAKLWRFFIVLQWVIVLNLLADTAVRAQSSHLELACQDCHAMTASLQPGSEMARFARTLRESQERLCGRCHKGAVEASHPSGFTPARALPSEFPLDWRGKMTCSTCHDFHGGQTKKRPLAADDKDLCLSCHEAGFFDDMPDGGRTIARSGHLDARVERPTTSMDAYSAYCAECHETYVSLPNDGIRAAYTANNGTGMMNHPIGSIYGSVTGRSRFRPAAALPKDILLPGGRVSCLSCHDGYSRDHGAIVPSGEQLCVSCHDM